MTEQGDEGKVDRYIGAVLRHLYLRREYRERVAVDLRAHICEASQEKTVDEVLQGMGPPREIAADVMRTYEGDYDKLGLLNALAYAQHARDYSVKSAACIGDWPLVHIAVGLDEHGNRNVARGIFAYGDIAIGAVAIGAVSMGVIAFGAIALGGVALGALAAGVLAAMGAVALSAGASCGALAIAGFLALGALSVARFWAIGAYARAIHYIAARGESAVVPGWLRSLSDGLATYSTCFAAVVSLLSLVLAFVPAILCRSSERNRGLGGR